MPEVRVVPEVHVRRRHTSSFWMPLSFLTIAGLLVIPFGVVAQGGAQGGGGARGGGGGRGGAAPAVPGAPPAPGGPAAAAPAGQGRGAPAGAPAGVGARGAAPVDLTGYWVSLVTEDYIERMFPDSPRSGVPRAGGGGGRGGGGQGAAGGRGGAAPAAAAPADPCRVYGAAGSMRLPGRLNITWADDNTLKIDMDAGKQTRLMHFGVIQAPAGEKTLQGYSIATWEVGGRGGGGGGRGGGGGGAGAGAAPAARWGSLNVVTTNMTGGYLLTSRTAYTENATLTEYFTRHTDFGVDYLTVVAIITDPGGNHTTSSTFKKEPNGSKFSPTGCDIVK